MFSEVNTGYLGYCLLAQPGIDSMGIKVSVSMVQHCSTNTNPTVSLCGCLIVWTAEEETMLFKMEDVKEQREGEREQGEEQGQGGVRYVSLTVCSYQPVLTEGLIPVTKLCCDQAVWMYVDQQERETDVYHACC